MKRTLIICLIISFCVSSLPQAVRAMTVKEAYRSIPHRQTPYDVYSSPLSDEDRYFLLEFLRLVEMAMVERVEMMLWLKTGGAKGRVAEYQKILGAMQAFPTPEKLVRFKDIVIEAVELQSAFLNKAYRIGGLPGRSIGSVHEVRVSSSKLQAAYGILINLFPNETDNNKQAFFDYLCALDFI